MQFKLIILILTIFISSCNFETKPVITKINFDITSPYKFFNDLIVNKLDIKQPKKFKIKINKLTANKYTQSYKDNNIYLYKLLVNVDFSVFVKDKKQDKLLFSNELSGQKFIAKPDNKSINELEIKTFNAIQDDLADKIIHIVNVYN